MLRPTRVVDKNNFSYNKNIVINTPNNIQNPNNKMSSDEINQNIQVFVRCRPLNTNEKKAVIDIVPEKRMIRTQQQNKIYSFDGVFNHDAKQTKVYRAVVEPLVEQVIEGYNCTVFAYGQTGTGKTYTMIGGHIDHNGSWEDDPLSGIIPRAIDQLLEELENQNAEYTIGVSFLELYNEDAYDLLSPLSDTTKLRIYNDAERKGSVIISGLVEMIVRSKAEIFEILTKGSLKRQTAPTLMNACSSRSHSIFSVTVHIKEITLDGEEVVKIGKLNLVDLAGSENIGRSGAVEERAREASNINKSLLTLGRVITSLVEKSSHIPYRDSKLTRLLQDSLGGRTKTSIIATISPCQDDIEDTISTLDYAQRAKKITNKPEINLKMSKKALINEYLQEIDRLRRDLEAARDKKGVFVDAKNYAYMEQTLEAQKQDLETKEAKLEHMKQEMEKMNHLLTQANNDISQKAQELADTMFELNQLTSEYQIAQLSLKQKQIEIKKVKLLLSAHRNNEEKLLKKANLVKTIADQCTNDNSKLMEKIDNLKSIETNNVNSIQNFSVAYDEQLNKIEQLNNLYLTILNDGHNSIDSIITENRQQLKMNEEKFAKNSNILNEKIENFLEKSMNNIQTNFNELIDKNTLLETIMMDVKSFIKNEFDLYEQNYLNILKKNFELLNEIEKMDQQYRNHQEQEIMSKIVQVNESSLNIKAMIKSIAEDNEKNYQLKCKEKEISSKKLNNMKLMIETMNNEKQIRSIENILNEIRQNQSKNISMINENIEYFETYLQNSLSNDFKYDENLKMKCSEIHHQINRNDKNIVEFLNDIDEHSLKNHEINCKQFSLMKNEQQKSSENFKNFSSQILTSINSAFDECSQQNQSIKESISNQIYDYQMDNDELNDDCNELINDNQLTIDTIMKLVNEQSNQTIANLDQIKNSMNALKIAQSSKTNNMKLEAKKLIENYKKYQPNGDTPKRINYQYPQTFTPTSPYDRILSRIQSEKLDQSPLVLSFEENEENSEVNDNDASASMNKTYCIEANSIENNLHNSKSSRILTTKN